MTKKRDFNDVMEEMDKIEEKPIITDELKEQLYEIYKDEIDEDNGNEKIAVSSIKIEREINFESSEQDRI